MLTLKVNPSEMKVIEANAQKYTGGNVSKWLRLMGIVSKPKIILKACLLMMMISACGQKQPEAATENNAGEFDNRAARVVRDCELVAENQALRFYRTVNGELIDVVKNADVYVCSEEVKFVEFRYAAGWSQNIVKEYALSDWPEGGIVPDFWNPNINCQIQPCSKVVE